MYKYFEVIMVDPAHKCIRKVGGMGQVGSAGKLWCNVSLGVWGCCCIVHAVAAGLLGGGWQSAVGSRLQ